MERSQLPVAIFATLLFEETLVLIKSELIALNHLFVFFMFWSAYRFSVSSITFPGWGVTSYNTDYALNVISLLGLLTALFVLKEPTHYLLVALAMLAFGFYRGSNSLPILPRKGLRSSLWLKNTVLSTVWVMITVLLPVSLSGQPLFTASVLVISIMNWCLIYALSILCDVRDIEKDSFSGVITFPVYFGSGKSRMISYLLLTAGAAASIFIRDIDGKVLTGLLCGFFLAAILAFFTNSSRKGSFYTWLVDGVIAVKALLVKIAIMI